MGRDSDRRNRRRAMQKQNGFDILSYTFRWTGQEIAWLYFCQIREIKKLRKRSLFKGATPVYKQETVDAYWNELMNRMPEGREPQIKDTK